MEKLHQLGAEFQNAYNQTNIKLQQLVGEFGEVRGNTVEGENCFMRQCSHPGNPQCIAFRRRDKQTSTIDEQEERD